MFVVWNHQLLTHLLGQELLMSNSNIKELALIQIKRHRFAIFGDQHDWQGESGEAR